MAVDIAFQPSAALAARGAAHIIRSDAEAIELAKSLAARFAEGAVRRDRERILPYDEVDAFSASGLWAITVPAEYGGVAVSTGTLVRVVEIISAADPSLGQIPQNHYSIMYQLSALGDAAQKRFFFGEILRGARLGNALAEKTRKVAHDFETRLHRLVDGYRLQGQKFYATGAIFAGYISVGAADEQGKRYTIIVDRDAPGLNIHDDWASFGQRTTASGTVTLDDVAVAANRVIPAHRAAELPIPNGAVAQIIQAAIDVGIAVGALAEAKALVRSIARPWRDAEVADATRDPYTIVEVGRLEIAVHAAQAMLQRAAGFTDRAIAALTPEDTVQASLAVAEAKIAGNDAALAVGAKLFELAGARATLDPQGLDRHWRNARVHTLHDPVRWKYNVIGNWALNGKAPPRHGLV